MPKVFPTPFHWHLATLSSLEASQSQTAGAHASAKLIYSYSHAIDGFSCALTVAEFQALQKSPGYVHSIKDLPVKYDTTHSPKFLGLVSTPGRSGAWEASNYGEGVIIGVVDSGVWPESRSFDDHGMDPVPPRWKGECETGTQFNASSCNNKLIGARVFTRGRVARNMTITMNSPRDEEGHGTHTASTAEGNFVEGEEESFFGYAPGTVKGVAPKAHVAMYKVDNGSFTSDYIAAIDWALRDGVDVLSLSLGFDDCALYDDAVALATFAAVDRNVFVATSAGNRGPMHGKIHNGIPWVLTVAAGTIGRELGAEVKLAGGGASVFGRSIYLGSYSTAEAPIVFLADCSSATEIRRRGAGRVVVCHVDKHTPGDPFANLQKNSGVIVGAIIISPSIIPDAALYFTFR
ncbi:unnamed protein product [Linum tenue]|uniref:Uncharacterized protein n=1 Tax=Linum tenue TaxID=586396 RepID=A0AAV0NPC3_9ROSI|nr:unnamed protein product [Linum tenue]